MMFAMQLGILGKGEKLSEAEEIIISSIDKNHISNYQDRDTLEDLEQVREIILKITAKRGHTFSEAS